MFNRVILIGRLTRDPELKRTGSGVALTTFNLAVDRRYKSQSGEKETDFFRIVTWDKLAEHCKEYLGKGLLVAVEGRVQVRQWETPQGERRSIYEIRADEVRFLERAGSRGGGSGSGDEPPMDSYDDEYGDDPGSGVGEKLFPSTPTSEKKSSGGRKDFGKPVTDSSLDDEIDLDDDEPF